MGVAVLHFDRIDNATVEDRDGDGDTIDGG